MALFKIVVWAIIFLTKLRCTGTGTNVGVFCTPAIASSLNRETWVRDGESGKLFLTPGICWTRKGVLNRKYANTS